eukprot:TRINITY_DN28311_c0_g1_i1.p1 TRINITY_DN28311_c0_g1~~TRINITY_DN28311_c0_g1_i1.p1  ORF type:complete len:400 (-),score=114.44 TRINITY_DN28311_c0_g1_i1:215-1414(-)
MHARFLGAFRSPGAACFQGSCFKEDPVGLALLEVCFEAWATLVSSSGRFGFACAGAAAGDAAAAAATAAAAEAGSLEPSSVTYLRAELEQALADRAELQNELDQERQTRRQVALRCRELETVGGELQSTLAREQEYLFESSLAALRGAGGYGSGAEQRHSDGEVAVEQQRSASLGSALREAQRERNELRAETARLRACLATSEALKAEAEKQAERAESELRAALAAARAERQEARRLRDLLRMQPGPLQTPALQQADIAAEASQANGLDDAGSPAAASSASSPSFGSPRRGGVRASPLASAASRLHSLEAAMQHPAPSTSVRAARASRPGQLQYRKQQQLQQLDHDDGSDDEEREPSRAEPRSHRAAFGANGDGRRPDPPSPFSAAAATAERAGYHLKW